MDTVFRISAVAAVLLLPMGCGPDVAGDGDEPPGVLEYESPTHQIYRLDRRLDIVGVDADVDRSGCGLLTDRAYDDLTFTLRDLDPNAEYYRADRSYAPEGSLYIDDFAYSPFACSWYCCHGDLLPMVIVYWAAASSLYGQDPNINGEIYVALEPDMPCPD